MDSKIFHPLCFLLSLLLAPIALVHSQVLQLPRGYVKATSADNTPGNRQMSFGGDPAAAAFATDRQLDVGSTSAAARASNGLLDESARVLLNSQRNSAPVANNPAANQAPPGYPRNWPVPPAVPNARSPPKGGDSSMVGRPNPLPIAHPRPLPLNNPQPLPEHRIPIETTDDVGGDPFTLPPLPPGYTDAPDLNLARDQPNRRSGDVSPSEIKDGRSLALYMLNNQYNKGEDAGPGRSEGGAKRRR